MAGQVLTDDQVKDLTGDLSKAIKDSLSAGFAQIKPVGTDNKNPDSTTLRSFQKSISGLDSGISRIVSTINSNNLSLGEAGAFAAGGLKDFGNLVSGIPFIGTPLELFSKGTGRALEVLTGFVQDNVDSFRALAKVGAGFQGDLLDISRQSAEAGMSLEQFTRFTINNSAALATLAPSVDGGVKQFVALSKALRDQQVIDQLSRLGMSFEEINEFTIKNIAVTRRQAIITAGADAKESQINAAQAEVIRDLAKNYTVIAKLTGKQVDEIQEEMIARQNDSAASAAVRLMEIEGAEGASDRFAQLTQELGPGPQVLKDLFKQVIATGVPVSEATKNYGALNGEVLNLMTKARQLVKSGASPEEIKAVAQQALDANARFAASAEGSRIAALRDVSSVAETQAQVFEETRPILDKIFNITGRFEIASGQFVKILEKLAKDTSEQAGDTTEMPRQGALNLAIETEAAARDVFSTIRTLFLDGLDSGVIDLDSRLGKLGNVIEDISSSGVSMTDAQKKLQGALGTFDLKEIRDSLIKKYEELGKGDAEGLANQATAMLEKFLGLTKTPKNQIEVGDAAGAALAKFQGPLGPGMDEIIKSLSAEQQSVIKTALDGQAATQTNLKQLQELGKLRKENEAAPVTLGGKKIPKELTATEAQTKVLEGLIGAGNKLIDLPGQVQAAMEKDFLDVTQGRLREIAIEQKEANNSYFQLFDKIRELYNGIFGGGDAAPTQGKVEINNSPENKITTTTVVASLDNLSTTVDKLESTLSSRTSTTLNDTQELDVQKTMAVAQVSNGQSQDKQSLSDDKLDQIINILTDGNRLAKNTILQMKNNGQGMIVS